MNWAYYNELDAGKAAWVRELIKVGVIAPGEVDERSITDVRADDLRGFRQCHFFAGIGVWSYALRLAGWPDDSEVWSGSCPCPSFSAAGKGEGFGDARHLWPDWFRLISECRPAVVLGEQVEAAIGHGWLDLIQTDMESAAYAVGSAVLTAAGVGAPHIRARLYLVAHAEPERSQQFADASRESTGVFTEALRTPECLQPVGGLGTGKLSGAVGGTPNATEARRQTAGKHGGRQPLLSARSEQCGATLSGSHAKCDGRWADLAGREAERRIVDGRDSAVGECADTDGGIAGNGSVQRSGEQRLLAEDCEPGERSDTITQQCLHPDSERRCGGATGSEDASHVGQPSEIALHANRFGATRGFWADCDWWYGRDGKWRPIKPGVQPLAHGTPARVLRLRGYGDAINAETAKAFIEATREAIEEITP